MNIFNLKEAIISKSKVMFIESITFFISILIFSINLMLGRKYFLLELVAEIAEIWIILYLLKSFFFNSKIGNAFNLKRSSYDIYFPVAQTIMYITIKLYYLFGTNIIVTTLLIGIVLLISVFDVYFKYIYKTNIDKIEYDEILKFYYNKTNNLAMSQFKKILQIKNVRFQIFPILVYVLLFSIIPSPFVIGILGIYVIYKLYFIIKFEDNNKLKYFVYLLTLFLTLFFIVIYILIDADKISLNIFLEDLILYSVTLIIPLFSYKIYYDNLFILYSIKFLIDYKGEQKNINEL